MEAEGAHVPLRSVDFWSQGVDWSFLPHVYRRSTLVAVAAALIFNGLDQRAIALGLMAGLAVALFSTWSVEMTVRLLFKEGQFASLKLLAAACVKLPMLLTVLLGVAWGAMQGYLNIFAVVGGILLVHGTLFAMIAGKALVASDVSRT